MSARARFGFAGLILCVVIAALGPAVSARAEDPPPPPEPGVITVTDSSTEGRLMRLTVSTFKNVTASDPSRPTDGDRYTWVEWTLVNNGGTTLTHPTVRVHFEDLCGAAFCTNPPSSTVEVLTPTDLPAGVACEPDDGALLCAYQNLPAGQPAPTTRAFFKTADLPATDTIITVTALVNERANDTNPCASGDPNCDEFALPITNPYEPRNDAAFTHALNGKSFHLTSNDGLSSFDFTSLSQSIFFASFKVLPPSTTHCFSTVVCFDRTLFSDTEQAPGFSTSNPVVFYIKLIDPPAGVTTKSLSAIHFYDAVSFATLGGRLFPPTSEPSYGNNGMDGLRLSSATAAALGIPFTDGKYFIVGHNGGDNSFRISLTKGGAALNPVNNAGFLGEPIRIIGDQSSERSTISCTTEAPAGLVVPSICVKKDGPKALEAWVWDRANGYVQW